MKCKKIIVIVEDSRTGDAIQSHDCGADNVKADKLEASLANHFIEGYHVYISYHY